MNLYLSINKIKKKKIGKSEGCLLITLILFDHWFIPRSQMTRFEMLHPFPNRWTNKSSFHFPYISGVQVSENGYRHLWEEEKILTVNLAMSTMAPISMTLDIGESHCPGDK